MKNNNFRKTIKEAMQAQGITQRELAKAMGSYASHVSSYLNGKRGFPSEKIEKAFDALGLEVVEKR